MKLSWRKCFTSFLTCTMLTGLCLFASAEEAAVLEEQDVPWQNPAVEESDPAYNEQLWAAEVYNYKMLRNFPNMFVAEDWEKAQAACNLSVGMDGQALTEENVEKLKAAKEKREAMRQVVPFSEGVLYIWGDSMPILTEDVESKFVQESYDNADFKPFLVPYLLENPGEAVGTIILISGGGNMSRSNPNEAYRVAPAFNELGYNCFILQRRVEPYQADEIAMDAQRAVRYVKYHAQEMGLNLEDTLLAISGYSGGGMNIRDMLCKYYGDITPDQFDESYVCDEIDAVNSDVDIAQLIYSGGALTTENPNLPHMFIAVGEDDRFSGSIALFQQAQEAGLDPELHIYGNVPHGFGAGNKGTSSLTWIETAHLYMQNVMGYAKPQYEGVVPEEYVVKQEVNMYWMSDSTIMATVYANASYSKAFVTFFSHNTNQELEFELINNHVAAVTYDKSGYFKQDAQRLWDLIVPDAWEPR